MWQSIPLDEESILTILAAVKVYRLKIDKDDLENLEQAYQWIIDEKILQGRAVNQTALPDKCESLPINLLQ